MMCGHPPATAVCRGIPVLVLLQILLANIGGVARGQAPQPYLFTVTSKNSLAGSVTFLRDDVAGPVALLPNSISNFAHNCFPSAIDPRGRFLYGLCGDGLSMYTLDATTGALSEVPASPYAASKGYFNLRVIAESSGQFVYLIKLDTTGTEATKNIFLDTFQVDAATPALIPLTSRQLAVPGALVPGGIATDPHGRGLALFLNQNLGSAQYPTAVLYTITFDPVNGTPTLDPSGGLTIGQTGRAMGFSPTGNYLAVGYGAMEGYFTVYQIGPNSFTLTSLGNHDLGPELTSVGLYNIPGDIYFSPDGLILYVQAPPANFTGVGGLPFLVFDTTSYLILPSSPILLANAGFIGRVESPQGPFLYDAGPNGGISVSRIDPVSGLPSQSGAIASSFYPSLGNLSPVLAPFGPSGGQASSGPSLSISSPALIFSQTGVGQSSTPQTLALKNIGNQALSLFSILLTGANSADFPESSNCMNPPVLSPNQTCVISVSYTPAAVGTSQAILTVTSNAPQSPQVVSLTGTAIVPPPPAPLVSFSPGSVVFPGNGTQGITSTPILLTLTNTGNAPLHITGTALGGNNSPDFLLGASTCKGAVNAAANCTVVLSFTPLAAGVRTATLTFTDDAANSPQIVAISGAALPAATIGAASTGGIITASIIAGQSAQFFLQAAPGAGFSGNLTFACSGMPLGATCSVPSSVAVANSSATPFTVTVRTSGTSAAIPFAPALPRGPNLWVRSIGALAAAVLCLILFGTFRQKRSAFPKAWVRLAAFAALLLAVCVNSCGGGGSSSITPPPPVVTPAGTYTITVATVATPSGSTRQLTLNPLQLTLTVK